MAFQQIFSFIRSNSLYHQLLRSYLTQLTVFGLVILLSVAAFYWINIQTSHYIEEIVPGEEVAQEILHGVNESLRLLNDWMQNPESTAITERRIIWEKTIYRSVADLRSLTGTDIDELANLLKNLHAYEIEQWVVEDIAHMPGNNGPYNLYSRKISPVKEFAFSAISDFIRLVSNRVSNNVKSKTLSTAADVRGFFTYADAKLIEFIHTGNEHALHQFIKNMEAVNREVKKLLNSRSLYSPTEQSLIIEFERFLKRYLALAEDGIQLRNKPQWNLANFKLNQTLAPLRRQLGQDLKVLLEKQRGRVNEYSKLLLDSGNTVLISSAFLLSALFLLSLYQSRKNALTITQPLLQLDSAVGLLAKSESQEKLDISGCDEVASLANTFNEMRLELEKRQRALLESLQKVEVANKAKNTFLSSMSHEFRTPLNAIMGFNQLMALDCGEQEDDSRKILHAEVEQAAQLMLRLVEAALEMATIDDTVISPEEVTVSTLLGSIVEMHQAKADECKVSLELMPFKNGCGRIFTDENSLRRIISSLVENAIFHNNKGGEVRINCNLVDKNTIRISVTDNGPGLPPDHLKRLFTPFDKLGKENIGPHGLGLGLAISKRLAELIDGKIGVNSREGQGCTFYIELGSIGKPGVTQTT